MTGSRRDGVTNGNDGIDSSPPTPGCDGEHQDTTHLVTSLEQSLLQTPGPCKPSLGQGGIGSLVEFSTHDAEMCLQPHPSMPTIFFFAIHLMISFNFQPKLS